MKKWMLAFAGFLLLFALFSKANANDFVFGRFDISKESELAQVQAFDSEQTKLKLQSVGMFKHRVSMFDWRIVYTLFLSVKRLDPELELNRIEYVIKFYDKQDKEIKVRFATHDEPVQFMDSSPAFIGDESTPCWGESSGFCSNSYDLEMEEPATLKIGIKSYVSKDGKVSTFNVEEKIKGQ